ncbi:DUF2878 domain-containing protein [Rheinheimera sp. WS51]|uniref:DUF2878 domain-containing protein n=1 Tax=Rheinheimera sp. WS51 TaxID=3425886 RepID=UPI003D8F1C38
MRLLHFVVFNALWFSAVYGREDWLWLSSILTLLLFVSGWQHLWPRRYAMLVLAAAGLLAESLMVSSSQISFSGNQLLPNWLILLWAGFVAMAFVSLSSLLHRRYWLAAIAGIVLGPVTYLTGLSFGAASTSVSYWQLAGGYALVWMIIMLLFVRLLDTVGNSRQQHE